MNAREVAVRAMGLVIVLVLLVSAAATASAQIYVPESLDRYFRIESHVERKAKGPVVWGYVYNKTNIHVERMVIKVEALDAAGAVIGSRSEWVHGLVPANDRAYFEVRVAEGAGYRVQVESFDWTGRGGGGGA